jgi:beta-mannosidase
MVPPTHLDLSGTWRAAPAADETLRRRYVEDDLDDAAWEPLEVPGHWRASPAFADVDGPVLYRTRFSTPLPADDDPLPDDRSFLVLDGVMAASDVWLDGSYLGDTSGYVVPHAFEVTDLLAARTDHLLAMEVSNGPVGPGRTRDLTGAFGRSALTGEGHNAGGIWRPVRVERTGAVRLRYSRLRCPEATPRRANLAVRAVLDSSEPRTVTLRTSVRLAVDADGTVRPDGEAPYVIEREHPLARGENRVEWTVPVADPELWWPRALGGQPLYDVRVDVLVDDRTSDGRTWRTGLREVRMDDFVCRVNGERLFLKGVSVGPTRILLADASPAEVTADVDLAVAANLDLLRVHGHVARPELYEAADTAGLLIWQDLPVQWGMQRGVKEPARRLARAAVDLLAHHPSVAIWCAHHEPWVADPASWRAGRPGELRRQRRRDVLAQLRPSWNRTVLDRAVSLVLDKSDGSRPVVAHSGVWPHLPQLSGTSTHLWAGWRWGRIDSLPRLLARWPRLGRFVGEFGAQAPGPDVTATLAAATAGGPHPPGTSAVTRAWPALDWATVADRTGFEAAVMVPPAEHPDVEAWADALRTHQAEVVRSHVETLRRLKYRPTGGFAVFALADPAPGITAALLDHERRAKPAWGALVEACAPTVVNCDRPPDVLVAGTEIDLEVHVVNDRRHALPDLLVDARATWTLGAAPGGHPGPAATVDHQRWEGDVDADVVARVGTIRLRVPPDAVTLALDLELTGRDGSYSHRRHHRRVATR